MEATLQVIDLKNIDRSKWKSYRFDEIAKNISERVDPNNTDLKVYVGLEHIDSESLHIKRTGTPDDVNGIKLRCYPGDIIFGRRRAYQRKAAIATFDGFCSAHSLVLRAKPEVIHPKLFPFFMHSDLFMNRAVDISVGSLSPTINWGTLKTQEFLLPPIEEQEDLEVLLWSINKLNDKHSEVLDLGNILFQSLCKQIFDKGEGKLKELKEIAKITMGQSPPGDTYTKDGTGFPFLQGNAEFGKEFPLSTNSTSMPNKIAKKFSILISVRAPVGDLNIADKDYCIGRGLAAIEVLDDDLRNYILNFLKYSKTELEKRSTGSTFKAINKDILTKLEISIPSNSKLIKSSVKLKSVLNSCKKVEQQLEFSKSLEKSLINQIFG